MTRNHVWCFHFGKKAYFSKVWNSYGSLLYHSNFVNSLIDSRLIIKLQSFDNEKVTMKEGFYTHIFKTYQL